MRAFRFDNVAVESVACELPPEVVSSAEVERRLEPLYSRLKLPEGRLELMSGVRERRLWAAGSRPSDGATRAGEAALSRSRFAAGELGALAYGAVCRDFLEPATASVVHRALGLCEDAFFYDVSNACLGFLNGMIAVASAVELGQIDAGLVVCGEDSRPLLEATIGQLNADESLTRKTVKPHFASLTIGSGAAAAVLCRRGLAPGAPVLSGGVVRSRTRHGELCRGGDGGELAVGNRPLMATDSEELLEAGIALAGATWADFRTATGLRAADVSRSFSHQVGSIHRSRLLAELGLDPAGDFVTFDRLGNTGSAALPTALALGTAERPLSAGERAVLLGIGSGLSSMMLSLVGSPC